MSSEAITSTYFDTTLATSITTYNSTDSSEAIIAGHTDTSIVNIAATSQTITLYSSDPNTTKDIDSTASKIMIIDNTTEVDKSSTATTIITIDRSAKIDTTVITDTSTTLGSTITTDSSIGIDSVDSTQPFELM